MTESSSSPYRRLLLLLIAVVLLGLGASPGQARLVDKVVAVVNDEVITQTELEEAGANLFSRLRQSTAPAELDEVLTKARRQVLAKLIEDLLVRQKATEMRLEVTAAELDAAIATIGRDNGMSADELLAELAKNGVSREEYRKKLTGQILHSKLLNYEIQSKIVISTEKAQEYYDTVYTRQKTAPGYHLLQFGLAWDTPTADTKEKARQKAEGIRKLALAGQDFQELCRSFSDLPSAKEGGDLGFFTEAEMADSMKAIILELAPGQTSEIIETADSYQFFRVLSRNINDKPEFAPFADVREEIIRRLRQEELDKKYEEWLMELRNQAIIKELL